MDVNHLNLSLRLSAAAQWVPKDARLCDVGTDHAALPIWLMGKGWLRSAIATDIRPGPLDRARNNVERYGFADRIQLRLCDGLSQVMPQEVDTVTICGMGGNMMISILQAAPWTRQAVKLILQPMKSLAELRRWLLEQHYRVEQERVVWEEGHWYPILLVQGGRDTVQLTPGSEAVGIPARWCREESRLSYLDYAMERLQKQRNGVKRSAEPDQCRVEKLQAALAELTVWRQALEKGVWPV